MKVGILKETFEGERRVAFVPDMIPSLTKKDFSVLFEPTAGAAAGFLDIAYINQGGEKADNRKSLLDKSDIIIAIRSAGADKQHFAELATHLGPNKILISLMDPLSSPEEIQTLTQTGCTAFALELMPRITRAQSMDVLSSMSTIAGYKAVIRVAEKLPKFFPMLMTAASTIAPAQVFVLGAGVLGLQAIATAKRLGARVKAYDIREEAKEQIRSLGATAIDLELEAQQAQDAGGYAKELSQEFYQQQQLVMAHHVQSADAIITTALIPGKKSPILITKEMVEHMRFGSVILDLAAERGGNCELTVADQDILSTKGVRIMGPTNLPSEMPYQASALFSKNISEFLIYLKNSIKEGELNWQDEIIKSTCVCHKGKSQLES